MKNILVPVGSSKNAESHLRYAVDFAQAFGAKLYVVQVFRGSIKADSIMKIDDNTERESLAFLKSHVEKVDTKDVEVIVKALKGKLVQTIELFCQTADIDLILIEPRTNSIKEEVYLGKTSGKIIKQTNIPALIVPENFMFVPIENILVILKSAIIRKTGVLDPLIFIKSRFRSKIELLLVQTAFHKEADFEVNDALSSLITHTSYIENAKTFQGVLESYKDSNPDLLCIVRRKKGFFTKIWENNTILKKDFNNSTLPVLVLGGLK